MVESGGLAVGFGHRALAVGLGAEGVRWISRRRLYSAESRSLDSFIAINTRATWLMLSGPWGPRKSLTESSSSAYTASVRTAVDMVRQFPAMDRRIAGALVHLRYGAYYDVSQWREVVGWGLK